MATKQAQPMEVQVNSAIDLRVTKSDIIELMLEEEEERLKKVELAARVAHTKLLKEEWEAAVASFKKKTAHLREELQKIYPGSKWGEPSENNCNRSFDLYAPSDRPDRCSRDRVVELEILLSKEAQARIETANKAHDDAYRAIDEFHRQSKKGRIAMTRKLLEGSVEGQAVLAKVGEVGKLLLSAAK